ncbi:MAG: energy transducer TonB [Candidatus Acidiferrales bacterium]
MPDDLQSKEPSMRRAALLLLFCILVPFGTRAQSFQNTAPTAESAAETYPNTPEGLRSLIQQILQAARVKDRITENELIHSLLISDNSTWFTDEYGPGFGASLAAAYHREMPNLEDEIRSVYEGNAKRGWTNPEILQYTDPEKVDSPIDAFLNCMDQIVPLYATAFQGDTPRFYVSLKIGGKAKPASLGDLNGYFIYDRGGFRFVPSDVLLKLPSGRPVRLQLDMNIMRSKIIKEVQVQIPQKAIARHISGTAIVEVVLDVNGNIKEAKAVQGDPILSAALMDAVKQWRFAPTTLDGDPVEVDLQIPFTFEIH